MNTIGVKLCEACGSAYTDFCGQTFRGTVAMAPQF